MNNHNAIVRGSLSDVAKREGLSLAESFLSCDCVILVDCSASMGVHDSRGGKARFAVALEELAQIQATMPGKIAVIAFSDTTAFVPGGVPPFLQGYTDLAGALKFAHVADVPGMRFVIISDGEPDDANAAMAEARKFKARIDVVYVGSEMSPQGRDFLSKLARMSGGQTVTANRVQELAAKVEALLLEA